jgi:hypothetical protein
MIFQRVVPGFVTGAGLKNFKVVFHGLFLEAE